MSSANEQLPRQARALLMQLVRDDATTAADLQSIDPEFLVKQAAVEGVVTQVYRSLIQMDSPRTLLETFRGAAVSQAGSALMLRQARNRALLALSAVAPIVLKGEVYARSIYPEYPDRPMGDMDILVQRESLGQVDRILQEQGYARQAANRGSLVMPQQSYTLTLTGNVISVIDVHSALFNRPAMSSLLTYSQLYHSGSQLKGLPQSIVAPSPEFLLLHAVLHLMGHHGHDQRLIWLLDIKLILDHLDAGGVTALVDYSHRHGLSAVLSGALENVDAVFPLDDRSILDTLRNQSATEENYALDPARLEQNSRLQQALDDWRALTDPCSKLTWLRQHLFPHAEYMKSHYSLCRTWSLPFFYLWRILRGAVKLLRPR